MRLHLGSASDAFSAKLHCRLCHQILNKIKLVRKNNNPSMQKCVLFSMDGQDSCSLLFEDPIREKSGFIKYHQSTEKPGALSTLWHAAPVWHLSSGHHTIIAGPLHSQTQHCSSHQALSLSLSLSLSLRIYLSEVSSLHVACSADWPGLHRGQCTQCLDPEHEVSGADCVYCEALVLLSPMLLSFNFQDLPCLFLSSRNAIWMDQF